MPLSLFPQPLAFHSFHFHQLHPPGFTPAHLPPSQIVSPSLPVIYLALVQNSGCLSRSDSRYPPYFLLPPQRLLRLYRLYTFLFLTLKHQIIIPLLGSLHCLQTPLLFSAISLFRSSLASNYLPSFFISLFLSFWPPRHASPSPMHPLYFSISPRFLPHIRPPVFPTRLPSFYVSRFPFLLWCPSGRSTLFSDSHQLFLDAALPTKVRGALFPTPAGVQPEVLACAARPSIYFSSCQAGYIPAAASMPYSARTLRVRSHYTLLRE